ncbi:MAG: hypothetical protein ACXADX_19380 [Candidatus Hodarchaeales archaeon]|jgi:hypothetical protein
MPQMHSGRQNRLENLDRLATLPLEDLVKYMADQGVLGALPSGENDNRELEELEKQAKLSSELRSE